MKNDGLMPVRKRKELVASGKSTLAPRKVALLHCSAVPEKITGPILSAKRKGATHKSAAAAGGATLQELKYMLELGESGHPAFREFLDDFLQATAEPVNSVIEAVVNRAVDEEASVDERKFALETLDPEEFGEQATPQSTGTGNTATFNVNINENPRQPDVEGTVEDSEFEE